MFHCSGERRLVVFLFIETFAFIPYRRRQSGFRVRAYCMRSSCEKLSSCSGEAFGAAFYQMLSGSPYAPLRSSGMPGVAAEMRHPSC